MINFLSLLFVSLSFLFTGCHSTSLHTGLQNSEHTPNPATVIAVPVMTLANPAFSNAVVDTSLLIAEPIVPSIENQVLRAFEKQPNINGYPFSVVRSTIEKNKSKTLQEMENTILKIRNRFGSKDVKERLMVTEKCASRKSFIEFYSYCVAKDPLWQDSLNHLSSELLNADSALLIFIDDLKDQTAQNQRQLSISVCALLVDTNNGKLIWANEKTQEEKTTAPSKQLKKWNTIIERLLAPDFWDGFPGRTQEATNHG